MKIVEATFHNGQRQLAVRVRETVGDVPGEDRWFEFPAELDDEACVEQILETLASELRQEPVAAATAPHPLVGRELN